MGEISGESGQTSMPKDPSCARDSEGMRRIPEQRPRHVVSGHLQPWHGVAPGPSPYRPRSSSFLEPLCYRILSIPST